MARALFLASLALAMGTAACGGEAIRVESGQGITLSPAAQTTATPTGLSKSGRVLWQFEALLRDTFGNRSVSAHLQPGRAINFACANKIGCAPLAYWSPYFFTFTRAHDSAFRVSKKRFPSGYFGNYPFPIWIRGQFIACDRAEKHFLITYSDAVGLSLDCK